MTPKARYGLQTEAARIASGVRLLLLVAAANEQGLLATSYSIGSMMGHKRRFSEARFQIFVRAGILRGIRGRYGGYHLNKAPREITLRDIAAVYEAEQLATAKRQTSKGLVGLPRNASQSELTAFENTADAVNDLFLGALALKTLADFMPPADGPVKVTVQTVGPVSQEEQRLADAFAADFSYYLRWLA